MAEHAVSLKAIPKTRVCSDCEKRKSLDVKHFHKQKPPRIPKHMPDYRWDCIKCHSKKVRKAYFKRTTKKERRVYMRNYHRVRYGVLPSNYKVAV